MVDLDKLEHLLLVAAKNRRPVTYSQILGFFERRTTPVMVRALCGDLGKVCQKLEQQGWPDLACLVVRKSDGMPGYGYFSGATDASGRTIPDQGPEARAFVEQQQEAAFDHARAHLQ